MPRPVRRHPMDPLLYDNLTGEVLLDGSYWGMAVRNFFSLYGLEVITGYKDGRIKARTARDRFVDLPRCFNIESDEWMFDPADWVQRIRGADDAK